MHTVAQLKQSVRGVISGVNINNAIDLNGKLERAAVTMLMKGDFAEMQNSAAINLYDGVFDNTPPPTIFGSLVQDLRPQGVSRDSRIDTVSKKPLMDFDLSKQRLANGTMITFEQRNTQQVMRIAGARPQARIMLDTMSVTDGWVAGGDASGLARDQNVFYDTPAALRINLAANGTQGYISKTINSADLTEYVGVGVVFVAVYLPTAGPISSVGVHLGSSSANYWDVSSTTGFLGSFVSGDWLIVALDLAGATTTGTVTATAITYLRVYINYASTVALPNVRLGGAWVSLASPFELVFETPAIFVPTGTTTPQKTISLDTDSIILGDAAYAVYTYECAREIMLGKGSRGNPVIAAIDEVLEGGAPGKIGLYQKYRGDNPAQALRTVGSYYDW